MKIIQQGKGNTVVIPAPAATEQSPMSASTAPRTGAQPAPALLSPEAARAFEKLPADTRAQILQLSRLIQSGQVVDKRFDKEFLNSLVKNLANPAAENQGIDSSCVASGELRGLKERNPSIIARLIYDLASKGEASLGGQAFRLDASDFEKRPADSATKYGFQERTADELLLQNYLGRCSRIANGRAPLESGATDQEIETIRQWCSGEESIAVFDKNTIAALAIKHPERMKGAGFSIRWVDTAGDKDEFHYIRIKDVQLKYLANGEVDLKNSTVSFSQSWNKETEKGPDRAFVKAADGSSIDHEIMSLGSFLDRARIGFFDASKVQPLGVQESHDPVSLGMEQPGTPGGPVITGFYYGDVFGQPKPATTATNSTQTSRPVVPTQRRFDAASPEQPDYLTTRPKREVVIDEGRSFAVPEDPRTKKRRQTADAEAALYMDTRAQVGKEEITGNPLLNGHFGLPKGERSLWAMVQAQPHKAA